MNAIINVQPLIAHRIVSSMHIFSTQYTRAKYEEKKK